VRYLIVSEAYRDLEQVSSRLVLTRRLAALLAQTPPGLLPTVCYLCQGLIAPEFAGAREEVPADGVRRARDPQGAAHARDSALPTLLG
jgi:hypothetical protein